MPTRKRYVKKKGGLGESTLKFLTNTDKTYINNVIEHFKKHVKLDYIISDELDKDTLDYATNSSDINIMYADCNNYIHPINPNASVIAPSNDEEALIPVIGDINNIISYPRDDDNIRKKRLADLQNTYIKHMDLTQGVIKGGRLHKECLKKYGRGIKNDSKTNPDLLSELTAYCSIVKDDEEDLKNKSIIKNYNTLHSYILANMGQHHKVLYINCNYFYKYTDCKPYYDDNKILLKYIDCFDYNEDIITSFENLLVNSTAVDYTTNIQSYEQIYENFERQIYSNNRAINISLKEQLEFLEKLPLYKKRILQDYTRINTSFHFYELYKNKDENFDTFRFFSDAFYTQIYKLYNDNYHVLLNDIYFEQHGDINPNPGNESSWYADWLGRERVPDKEEKYGVVPKIYEHATKTIFSDVDFIDWRLVVSSFLEDVSFIILEAPEVKETIHGYRGVSSHYIHESDSDAKKNKYLNKIKETLRINKGMNPLSEKLNTFINSRISSITFDFNISKSFHDKFIGETSAIYKTSIQPGCKVLLIAPLSMFYQEFEILTPQYTTISYIAESHDTSVSELTTNNIEKNYGICIKQEFKVYSNIILRTPQTIQDFLLQPAIYEAHKKAEEEKEKTIAQHSTERINNLARRFKDKPRSLEPNDTTQNALYMNRTHESMSEQIKIKGNRITKLTESILQKEIEQERRNETIIDDISNAIGEFLNFNKPGVVLNNNKLKIPVINEAIYVDGYKIDTSGTISSVFEKEKKDRVLQWEGIVKFGHKRRLLL